MGFDISFSSSAFLLLKDAGYVDITKQFKDNYPLTLCKITPKGIDAFEQYVKDLQQYLQVGTIKSH